MKPCPNIVIGADPEFAVRQNGKSVGAYTIYSNHLLPGAKSYYVGVDGCDVTGEIRPAPGKTTKECASSIKACIALAYLIAKDRHPRSTVAIYAGAYRDDKALGGHVHFGGAKADVPYKSITEAILNKTLGVFTRVVIDEKETLSRLSTSYGKFRDKRHQSWGTEWRTPPSWILSEDFATAFLEIAFFLYSEVLTKTENYGILREFVYGEPSEPTMENWSLVDQKKLVEYSKRGVDLLNKLFGAKFKYAKILLDMVASENQCSTETSLFESWGIIYENLVPELIGPVAATSESHTTKEEKLITYLNKMLHENSYIECARCKNISPMIIYGNYKNVCDSCGYTLCDSCLHNHCDRYNRNNITTIPCPSCNKPFYIKNLDTYSY